MKILKTIIYHLFLVLKGIFFPIFDFIAGLLGLEVIFVYFVVYFIKHFYDKIIFWAKPDDIDLTLFK